MKYLPIFLDLSDAPCLVVGGGIVGARRAGLLAECGARVTVVAPELCDELARAVESGDLTHHPRPYAGAQECAGMRVVVAATDDEEVNARVAQDARDAGIPINVVDRPTLCSFIMPAVVDRDPVIVAVSTGGASPVLARMTRGRLEAFLHPDYGRLADLAERYRARVKGSVRDPAERRRLWERALSGRVAALVLSGRGEEAERELEALIDGETRATRRVTVIFAGDGDVQQQSLRAAARLGAADVVVHPPRGVTGVIALARRDAAREQSEGDSAGEVLRSALRVLETRPGLATLCVVLTGLADASLEPALAALGSFGDLELVHPAPR